MGGPTVQKRYEIVERRKTVANMYRQGKTQWEIARHVGRDQGTISDDIKAIRQEWKEARVADFDAKLEMELARIDLLEEKAWEQFLKSCDPAETETYKVERAPRAQKPKGEDNEEELTAELVVIKEVTDRVRRGQSGNPAFLTQIQWCIETRLKLIGAFDLDNKSKAAQVNIINWGDMTGREDEPDPIEAQIEAVKALPEAVEDAVVEEPKPAPAKKKGKR